MNSQRRKSYHHGDLRSALIESVAKLARESQSLRLTVKDLTDTVGVTPAAFYRHFSSVEELVAEARVEGLELFEQAEKEVLRTSSRNPVERVEALVRSYVRFAAKYPGHFRIMTDSEAARTPDARLRDRPALGLVAEAIVEGQQNKEIIPGNPKDLAIAAWASVHGLAGLLANGPLRTLLDSRPARARQLEDVLVSLICRGLMVAPLDRALSSADTQMGAGSGGRS